MKLLDLDRPFTPLLGAPVLLPEDMLFYRGYDTAYPAISHRTTHYGTHTTAAGYANVKPSHRLGCFSNSRALRLFDIRYIQTLLTQLFQTRQSSQFAHLEPIARITLAYGLCALYEQLHLMQKLLPASQGTAACLAYYAANIENKTYEQMPLTVNPFTPAGIRVGETNNDALCLVLLKEVFGHLVDGFIAPSFQSVFHVEKGGFITAEMVLFDPENSGIRSVDDLDIRPATVSIEELLNTQSHCQWLQLRAINKTRVRVRVWGGGAGYTQDTSAFFDRLENKDPATVKAANRMKRFAANLSKRFSIIDPTAPHPSEPLVPWTSD